MNRTTLFDLSKCFLGNFCAYEQALKNRIVLQLSSLIAFLVQFSLLIDVNNWINKEGFEAKPENKFQWLADKVSGTNRMVADTGYFVPNIKLQCSQCCYIFIDSS